ncbi:RNA polymerase sigma factor [Alkaliphilus oremlandii]|uniref:RNA polymerase, sigma-24 subunit, ECF subfamily n=1 Tax=Alkaliphilus oremlandii (strain OhILAs) TaxID=350688 RepID=A8MFU0_ALKOO|nr:RNA polymerase sigma factor [Alkaliphilus oremlandii]ABW17729.1 RNA polymerase, sigma-24 subunit, ECF subfamily [Alkaliphilus oremlandii OhILAs]
MEKQDDDLIRDLKLKDLNAYHKLIEYYGEKLLRLAYIIIGDYQLAEDALQESYINIYRHINHFNEKSSLLTWVTRITINNAKQALKKKNKRAWNPLYHSINESSNSPPLTYDIIQKEEYEKVNKTLMSLPIKYREALYLHYYEELKIKEIANILDIGESGVKSRLQRGRTMLEEMLRKELD